MGPSPGSGASFLRAARQSCLANEGPHLIRLRNDLHQLFPHAAAQHMVQVWRFPQYPFSYLRLSGIRRSFLFAEALSSEQR
jgi:hypothetical protein